LAYGRKGEHVIDSFFKLQETRDRYREGPLGPYIDDFVDGLQRQGYAQGRLVPMISLVAGFSRWLGRRAMAIPNLSDVRIDEYLRYRRARYKIKTGDRAPLRIILGRLRSAGIVAPEPRPARNRIEALAEAFREYLARERQAAPLTQLSYLPSVRLFLTERFGNADPNPARLTPKDVIDFVRRHAHDFGPGRAKHMLTSLRMFFRFLRFRGKTTTDLISCLPDVPNWKQTGLPKVLRPDEVERILECCDRLRPPGRRNYAILVLLARLGLRGGELVRLTLDDLHWETGEITVGGKGKRWDRLPLPDDAGRALVEYLERERPRSASRRVFLRSRAPLVPWTTSGAITRVVANAIARAGVRPARTMGAYLFRHTLATRMLAGGASLAEIGEILRHRSPDTTAIYAKVDLGRLRTLALPWPGGAR
jgi:site-specific recombinase XerD